MRARVALGCIFVLLLAVGSSSPIQAADKQQQADDLLLEAFKIEKSEGDTSKTLKKFEDVLKADPENYYALIKLGTLKTENKVKFQGMDANDYFLLAALSKPSNPEAYLYLAQNHYKQGYMMEGDSYLKMARGMGQSTVYDTVCMEGWRYEDTGNYYAAILTYASPALSINSPFYCDAFLMKRLYDCILLSPRPYNWVYGVVQSIWGEQRANVELEKRRTYLRNRFSKYPDTVLKMVLEWWLRQQILAELEVFHRDRESTSEVQDRHELPKITHKLFFCNPSEIPERSFDDPYEAFVKASPGSDADHDRVLAELKKIKERALEEIASAKTDEEKAKELFIWLKKNVLKEYHALDGISAKGIVDSKRYLCLSGSILYTLLARDANLKVNGVLVPGHAYAVLNKDRPIRIETTTDGPEGYDYKPDPATRSRESDRVLYQTAFDTYGEVPDNIKFVAHQYHNTALASFYQIAMNDYEPLFREVLKSKLGLDTVKQTEAIDMWRRHTVAMVMTPRGFRQVSISSPILEEVVLTMAAKDEKCRSKLVKQIEDNIESLKVARSLSPFDFKFRNLIDFWIEKSAKLEYMAAQLATKEREERRLKLMQEGSLDGSVMAASIDQKKSSEKAEKVSTARNVEKELVEIEEEAKQKWPEEKDHWMKGLNRLAGAVKQYPCNENLRRALARVYQQIITLAEQQQDAVTMSELKRFSVDYML